MVEVVLPISAVAASGLAFLAYHHPAEFTRLAVGLSALAIVVALCLVAWDFAIVSAKVAASPFVAVGKTDAMRQTLDSLRLPAWLFLGVPLGLSLVLWALNRWATKLKGRG